MNSPIITPGSTKDITSTARWCDCFSICIEVQAEASHNTAMHATLKEAAKKLRKEGNRKLAENQDAVGQIMKNLTMEDYHDKLARWKVLKQKVMSAGWDLSEEIYFEQTHKGVAVYMERNGLHIGEQLFTGAEGLMICDFLEFVQKTSAQAADPRIYVRQMLAAQGITKENFHLHADKLLVENPWAKI